ncbi:MAG: cytochrome c family protein [Cyclobacteriaceae bacterium]|nr:cytochrome c family protein [Cyclobacteriaceae bacterium]
MKQQVHKNPKATEWGHKLLLVISGLLLFETITGLSIYFLPFSLPNQVMVLLHTVIGLIFIVPYTWYQLRHWRIYKSRPMNHFVLTGYTLLILCVLLIISGVVLTWQAAMQTKIGKAWDLVHTYATFALVAFSVAHVVLIMARDFKIRKLDAIKPVLRAQVKLIYQTLAVCVILFGGIWVWMYSYQPVRLNNKLPSDYSFVYGEDRPFAPSLATTESNGAYDPITMGGSEGCGTTGCHEEIYKEWQVSAHRYAAMDVGFQKVQAVMGEQNGPESTRYCGGCHDPISLFSGNKTIYTQEDDLTSIHGYQEGISCIACHAIKETDVKGNANYVISQPERYMYELNEGKTAKFLSDFLIRSYPQNHVKTLQHKMFKSPEFCAACHKQFIDEEVNNVGWVQLQNQYDNWRKSKWNHPGDPEKTIECRECHMPLIASDEPASGDNLDYNRTPDDKKHRSHRFLAANQFMPLALDLPGAEEHVKLTEQWLQGKIKIPEIADKWDGGEAVPIELIVPERVAPGEEVNIEAVVTNKKVGHDFPTGPLDIIQAWVELIVTDQDGNEIFASGKIDEKKFVQPGSFIFKVEPVDQYGNLIDRHNLWEMVGVRFRRSMFPGFSDKAAYTFGCPSTLEVMEGEPESNTAFTFDSPENKVKELHVTARLMYRKFDQFLLNFLFGEDAGITARITRISEDTKIIRVDGEELLSTTGTAGGGL